MDNYNTLPDEQLVKLYANGDNKAFEILLMRHKDKLYGYIFNLTHQTHLTDDIFQETFMKVIVNIKENRYTETGKFFGWITRIAHNLFIDYHRREDNENTISNDASEISLFDNNVKIYDQSLQDTLSYEETLQGVERLIDKLPNNQRDIVIMRYYQNMSFKEIAEKQSVSINTALGRMHYAIQNLKKMAETDRLSNEIELGY
ncbi:MAG: sigma-70 family RNA polymerase sigma factor [Bacteroidales bacterium]|nr:sigma-70 family RNA polymerase sigma factor [Bacteroidales bacterium]